MTDIILWIYDYMRRHTIACVTTLCISTALLILLVASVNVFLMQLQRLWMCRLCT